MKKLLTTLPILLGFTALAEYDYIRLPDDNPVVIENGGRLCNAFSYDLLSLYRIDEQYQTTAEVTTTAETNTTYCLSYTNAVGSLVTNITDYDIAPLPAGYAYVGYWTNTVVSTTSTTNWVTTLAQAVTNAIFDVDGPIDDSDLYTSGYSTNSLNATWLLPGTKVYSPQVTQPGTVLILEK